MNKKRNKNVLIIGVGNEFRSEDFIGLKISRMLKSKLKNNIIVKENLGDSFHLIELWKDFETVIIIDAVIDGISAGKIYKLDLIRKNLPKSITFTSSHLFNIPEAVETARVLNILPKKLIFYGISIKHFNNGKTISDEVSNAADKTVNIIIKDLSL